MKSKKTGIIAVVIIVGLFSVLWFSNSESRANRGPVNLHGGVIGSTLAPDFTLQKFGGGTISVSEFKGQKPVVLDFWTSWCHNCQRAMPKLSKWHEKYDGQFEVIGVNMQENPTVIKNFVDSRGIGFPIALDPTGQVSRLFGVRYTNTHVLVDRNGNMLRTVAGDLKESDIINLISS